MLKYTEFETVIQKLSDRSMREDQYFAQYVLQPYLTTGLRYDIYDIENVEMLDQGLTFRFRNPATDGVKLYFSLKDTYRRYTEEDDRVFLHIDIERTTITLYFKVLGEWNLISQVKLFEESPESRELQEDNLNTISRTVDCDEFKDQYNILGEKYFTSVVFDNLINQGDVHNVFVRQAIIKELNNPSDAMIELLATGLGEYSTQSPDWIKEQLEPIKDIGAIQLLEKALEKEELELKGVPKPTPRPASKQTNTRGNSGFMKNTRQVVEEQPVNVIEDKQDELQAAGFGIVKEDKEDKPRPPLSDSELLTKAGFGSQSNKPADKKDERSQEEIDRSEDGTVDLTSIL